MLAVKNFIFTNTERRACPIQTLYIHYNENTNYPAHFDPLLFSPIKNGPDNKPLKGTGLWASPLMSEYGWRDWCADNMPWLLGSASSFCFTLRPEANVIRLRSISDVLELVNLRPEFVKGPLQDNYKVCLDFEHMVGCGVDALEVSIKMLAQMFEGWDCDSLLVMNPDVVVPV